MSRATVAEMRAYLSSPVKAAGGDGGLVSDAGASSTEARFADATIQDSLDAADAIVAAEFEGVVTIPAASVFAKRMSMAWAAADLLGADGVEIAVIGQQSRASWHRQRYDDLVMQAKRSPSVFGAASTEAVYTSFASD